MFIEEAQWLRSHLATLELPPSPRVLNLASSTQHYRTVEQPHNETEVIAPLRARGAEITHLDIKAEIGVDAVMDLTSEDRDLAAEVGDFDLVLATSLFAHLRPVSVGRVYRQLIGAVRLGGYVVVTTPESYRRTIDPLDGGYRPRPADVVEALGRWAKFEAIAAEVLRIDDPRYYKRVASRSSSFLIGGRWITLPGATEQIRRIVPRWHWREACVIVRRIG